MFYIDVLFFNLFDNLFVYEIDIFGFGEDLFWLYIDSLWNLKIRFELS